MKKLIIICTLAFAFAWLICYGAMRTAEKFAANQNRIVQQIELDATR